MKAVSTVIFTAVLLAACATFAPLSKGSEPVATIAARPGVDSDRVDLFAEQATCPQETKRAVFTYRASAPRELGSTKVEGCWALIDANIYMVFEDGDRGVMPANAFKWASGQVPKPLV